MAKRFVVEEVRALSWSLRLRDTETGEVIDVPMNPGSRFSPPGARGREKPEHEGDQAIVDAPAAPVRASTRDAKKVGKKKRTARSGSGPADAAKPTTTREELRAPIDEKTLTTDDRKVIEDHRTFWANVLGAKGSKKGGLGWEETTDAGRSGLRARFKSGFFKILHAGGDVYGLFYEWDGGKYERIACGKAEDMMEIATKRALGDMPPPPKTMLDLEAARFLCGGDAQRELAAQRLAPIFSELEARADKRRAEQREAPPRTRGRRNATSVTEPSPSPSTPPPPSAPPPTPHAEDTAPDPKRDAELMHSLSQALAEMED